VIRQETVGDGGTVWLLTLDRQDRRNALDVEHWMSLAAAVEKAAGQGARAIVLTGAGSAFCAGADLNDITVEDMAEQVEHAFGAVRDTPIPVIAYINGPAVGAGTQLAVSCDLRVASPKGRFRLPAAQISLPVHPGTIRRLVALAGMGTARAILLGGDWVGADRAYALGLADRMGDLNDAIGWASEISGYAPLVLGFLKDQLQLANLPDSGGYRETVRSILDSEDFAEAMRARKEGRPPKYLGR
jgi:enoyl-CoA hydratase/carnithine racemase